MTKDAKGVARDAKKVIYFAAQKKYQAYSAAVNRVSVDADPIIVGLRGAQRTAQGALTGAKRAYQRVTQGGSVDRDPRVVALFVARNTALAGVRTAQDALKQVHRLPVDADPRVAGNLAARETALAGLNVAMAAVNVTGDTIQTATSVLAAATEGEIIAVTSVRLKGRVDVFESGGRAEMVIQGRVLKRPQTIRIAVSTGDLENGNLFKLASNAARPKSSKRSR